MARLREQYLGLAGIPHQHVAMIQILGPEAVALRAEQQCGAIFFRQRDNAAGDFARRREFPVVGSRPRRRAGDEGAIEDGLGHAVDDARAPQNVVGTRGQRGSFRMGK